MVKHTHQTIFALLDNVIEPLPESGHYSSLLESVGDARIVMIGEATHGTQEFYMAVAIEGDWPDAHRVHRFIQARSEDPNAAVSLDGFKRFPTWM